MNIVSSDSKRSISLGGADTWQALCATVNYHLRSRRKELSHVFKFLEKGHCASRDCLNTAREFNLVRDALSQLKPDQIVFNEKNPQDLPPWGDKISPVITSCGNYLTSGDGDDLLAELVKIFTYAAYAKADIDLM